MPLIMLIPMPRILRPSLAVLPLLLALFGMRLLCVCLFRQDGPVAFFRRWHGVTSVIAPAGVSGAVSFISFIFSRARLCAGLTCRASLCTLVHIAVAGLPLVVVPAFPAAHTPLQTSNGPFRCFEAVLQLLMFASRNPFVSIPSGPGVPGTMPLLLAFILGTGSSRICTTLIFTVLLYELHGHAMGFLQPVGWASDSQHPGAPLVPLPDCRRARRGSFDLLPLLTCDRSPDGDGTKVCMQRAWTLLRHGSGEPRPDICAGLASACFWAIVVRFFALQVLAWKTAAGRTRAELRFPVFDCVTWLAVQTWRKSLILWFVWLFKFAKKMFRRRNSETHEKNEGLTELS